MRRYRKKSKRHEIMNNLQHRWNFDNLILKDLEEIGILWKGKGLHFVSSRRHTVKIDILK